MEMAKKRKIGVSAFDFINKRLPIDVRIRLAPLKINLNLQAQQVLTKLKLNIVLILLRPNHDLKRPDKPFIVGLSIILIQ